MRFIKWVRFFERNCIVKWVIFLGSFCWLWDFLLKNLKLKKKTLWCPLERKDKYKKVVCPKKYFQKNNFKYEILSILYFGPNFVFWGNALGVLVCFFFNFSTSASHDSWYFYSAPSPPPTIKKLPTALRSDDYYFGVTKNNF